MRSRARISRSARALSLAISAVCVLAFAPAARADDGGLHQARQDLRDAREQIRERSARLRDIQRGLNRLATRISREHSLVGRAAQRIDDLESDITVLERHQAALEERLGDRNRAAYILGPGVPVLYLLTSTSAEDAAARMSILTEMNRRDSVLAEKVASIGDRLDEARLEAAATQRAREIALRGLEDDRKNLHLKLKASRRLFASLQDRKDQILDVISRYRPFSVCPVAGPVAVADNFGVWVHRPEKQGGDHVHQGNDMMAAYGTPIVAPFDGTAVVATNHIGGLAVKVFGKYGYVYNAHLSRFGQLGAVHAGDVIGYVGATGDTNANHDHFEWHPGNGSAVDPHTFLMAVC
jgi:murein DD-endopeptidase MepM/ murein hydrolase activator NlpD